MKNLVELGNISPNPRFFRRSTVGGGCPKGRRAEDGRIPDRYPLVETPDRNDQTRTRRNIEDSDGTLILNLGKLDGGTALTVKLAHRVALSENSH
jgi:hypothetical protein